MGLSPFFIEKLDEKGHHIFRENKVPVLVNSAALMLSQWGQILYEDTFQFIYLFDLTGYFSNIKKLCHDKGGLISESFSLSSV